MQAVIETIAQETLNELGLSDWYARHEKIAQRRKAAYRRYRPQAGPTFPQPNSPHPCAHIGIVDGFTNLDLLDELLENVAFYVEYDKLPNRLADYFLKRSGNYCRFCS